MKYSHDKIGKWQFFATRDFINFDYPAGWHGFSFGIIKIIQKPAPGAAYGKNDYRGIWVMVRIWLPIRIFQQR